MAKGSGGFEKRVNQRYDVTLPLNIGDGKELIKSTTKNISCSGLYCQVNKYIPVMTKIQIAMDLWVIENGKKAKKSLVTNAVVVRIEPEEEQPDINKYYIGLFFLGLIKEHRDLIALYIEQTFLASNN